MDLPRRRSRSPGRNSEFTLVMQIGATSSSVPHSRVKCNAANRSGPPSTIAKHLNFIASRIPIGRLALLPGNVLALRPFSQRWPPISRATALARIRSVTTHATPSRVSMKRNSPRASAIWQASTLILRSSAVRCSSHSLPSRNCSHHGHVFLGGF